MFLVFGVNKVEEKVTLKNAIRSFLKIRDLRARSSHLTCDLHIQKLVLFHAFRTRRTRLQGKISSKVISLIKR